MNKICKFIWILFLSSVVVMSVSLADTVPSDQVVQNDNTIVSSESTDDSNVPIKVGNTTINTQDIDTKVQEFADAGETFAYKIIEQISDKSAPICAILILWGAVLYFILGIRNLYKKRQGLLLMWGALTFCVIAKVVNFAFWFAFVR